MKIENNKEFIMKNCLKVFTILALVALLFTACGEKTTVYRGRYQDLDVAIIFNSDGTFVQRASLTVSGTTVSADWYKGTYTGKPSQDGNLTLTFTHEYNSTSQAWEAVTSMTNTVISVTVNNGQFTLGLVTYSRN